MICIRDKPKDFRSTSKKNNRNKVVLKVVGVGKSEKVITEYCDDHVWLETAHLAALRLCLRDVTVEVEYCLWMKSRLRFPFINATGSDSIFKHRSMSKRKRFIALDISTS